MMEHKFYEVLCTLAATGQLADGERAEFHEHCRDCADCRNQLQELLSIGTQLQIEAAMHATFAPMPAGSVERFRARATREGIAPRTAPARAYPSYVMAMAAAVFVVAALVFMPHGRRSAESVATVTAEQIPRPQHLAASIPGQGHVSRHARVVAVHFQRRHVVPQTDMGGDEVSLAAQRFPQMTVASYPFFGLQSATKPSETRYSTLSRAQISRLDFFRGLDEHNSRSSGGIATARTIDIASTGSVFDFATNIRQLHFQLSTAQ